MISASPTTASVQRFRFGIMAALATAVFFTGPLAHAAVGFISSGQVRSGAAYAELSLQFRCNVHYVAHAPENRSDILKIRIEPTTVCMGVPPTVALTRQMYRPLAAQDAWLDSVEYDGQSPGNEYLLVTFNEEVRYDVRAADIGDSLVIRVFPPVTRTDEEPAPAVESGRDMSRRVQHDTSADPKYVINLESSTRRPSFADLPQLDLPGDTKLFVSDAIVDGTKWFRVRVGYFDTAEQASRQLRVLRSQFPSAWIGHAAEDENEIEDVAPLTTIASDTAAADSGTDIAALMMDAKRAMTAGEVSRAVQLYTKVLQQPASDYRPQAQEYLALARERNGQIAHAKAEYERYLEMYPDGSGSMRVRQRLAALLATGASPTESSPAAAATTRPARRRADRWTVRTFLSQYYRRDVNQVNDQQEVVNQSSIYTDVSIDARRRGERFDFASRITAGYRSDLLDEEESSRSDRDLRVSYAYADLADARTGLRGRIGRQTRNTGGVLGRFDGLNLSYALNDSLRFEAVAGQPVFSTSRDLPDSPTFYGLSSTFTPFTEALEFGVFYLQQGIESMTDRRVVGSELRYFGAEKSLWGIVSYDAEFAELGSAFLQGSWRTVGNMTLTGLIDFRRSPFLSLGNALVGQQVDSFEDLTVLFTEDELRQFALDRSPEVATFSFGVSRPLTPKLQFNVNASHSVVGETPESGGVPATEQTTYSYFSTDLVASSLFTEGDVGIIGLRYAVSDTTNVYSMNLDTRFPVGRRWRINPRLRVDYREILADQSTQWNLTPGLRIQFRPTRRWRIELEGGQQFSRRRMETSDLDREFRFVYLGYQYSF